MFNVNSAVRVAGPLDVESLRRAFAAVSARHAVLRSRFEWHGDDVVGVTGEPGPVEFSTTDVSEKPRSRRLQCAQELLDEAARRTFDLRGGNLLRVSVIRLGSDEHLVFWSVHHIVFDGWSQHVLCKEVSAAYSAFRRNERPDLPELPIQFPDFVRWQRARLASGLAERQLDYWRSRLANVPSVLELPTDLQRPAMLTYRGGTHQFEIGATTVAELRRLGGDQSASLFMTMLAIFQVLLFRHTRSADILVSVPTSGRESAETGEVIGVFVNRLALHTHVNGDMTFREVLSAVRRTALEAYEHQDVPFEQVVDELVPIRESNRNPLTQVHFHMGQDEQSALSFDEAEVARFATSPSTVRSDLELYLRGGAGSGLVGRFMYSSDLFRDETVERLAKQFATLASAVVEDADRPVGRLELLTERDRDLIVRQWNATGVQRSGPVCVHELFQIQAKTTPDAVALTYAEGSLTYAELDRLTNRLAHYLQGAGVGPDVVAAVCVPRGPEMTIALLAVLKAGGAYLPLDPAYPAERLGSMLKDADAAVFIGDPDLSSVAMPSGIQVVRPSEFDALGGPDTEPSVATTGEHLAYLIYTSGSTGVPKGVAVPHQAFANSLTVQAERFGIGQDDRLLQVLSPSFDAGSLDIFLPLVVGATLCLAPAGPLSPGTIVELLRKYDVTVVQLPYSAWAEVVGEDLPKLQVAIGGGESCSIALAEALSSERRFFNAYGVTEAAVTSTLAAGSSGCPTGRVPIGWPIANVRTYVLDEHLAPVPIGVVGDLYIGGVGLARGYHRRPALTAEHFIPDPFGTPGARIYRTGDLVRCRADGAMEFIGRRDQQINLRGYRIELGEIESALISLPTIGQAVAAVHEEEGSRTLVAYVTLLGSVGPNIAEIRDALAQQLPAHMIPTVVVLDELPRTPSGKVDRSRLPALTQVTAATTTARSHTEKVLTRIWQDILAIESPIDVNDDFFQLGGHSLLAAQVALRIRQDFTAEISVRTLFEAPTIRSLAAVIDLTNVPVREGGVIELSAGGAGRPLVLIHPVSGAVSCYLELAQALGRHRPVYAIEAPGLEDPGEMDASIEAMARRYAETLRPDVANDGCLIGGWSLGGVIAVEVARHLAAAGATVAGVALIDSWLPGSNGRSEADDRSSAIALARDICAGAAKPRELELLRESLPIDSESSSLLTRVAEFLERQGHGVIDLDRLGRIYELYCNNARAIRSYRPTIYQGQAWYFVAQESEQRLPGQNFRKMPLGSEAQVQEVMMPGDHHSILRPPIVTAVAERLSELP